MADGKAQIRVRPLRLAFLVGSGDTSGLREAIRINSSMWGGANNPIVPVFHRPPVSRSRQISSARFSAKQVVSGYLAEFDPDFVVPIGSVSTKKFEIGHREVVQAKDLLRDFAAEVTPSYGLGFHDLLHDLVQKSFQYVRRDDAKIVLPTIPKAYGNFLASVFGEVEPQILLDIQDRYASVIDFSQTASIEVIPKLLEYSNLFPSRITSRHLVVPRRDALVFLCDAKSNLDILDYWNLRAAGNNVLPFPIQAITNQQYVSAVKAFIRENHVKDHPSHNFFRRATIQYSRTIDEGVAEKVVQSLRAKIPHDVDANFFVQPSFLFEWPSSYIREARRTGRPFSYEEDVPISSATKAVELRTFDPKFPMSRATGNARWANDFSFRFYGDKELLADTVPYASKEMSNALGRVGYHHWRFSLSGPTFLADHEKSMVYLEVPKAEVVVIEWLKERGWSVVLSGPGQLAKQLFFRVGGRWGLSLLASEPLLRFLSDSARSDRGKNYDAMKAILSKGSQRMGWAASPDRFLKRLVDARVLRLGVEVKCSVCERFNWKELADLDYELTCRYCVSKFHIPQASPRTDIEWTYRPIEPFNIENFAQGSYAVLLAYRFFCEDSGVGVTPLFSYEAKKGKLKLEADISMLYQPNTWGSSERNEISVVHVECKSYNLFEARDINRMRALGKEFPGATLVFATLKSKLKPTEKQMLRDFANAQRRKRQERKPYCHVMVLTGLELFSEEGAPHCWEALPEIYKQVEHTRFRLEFLEAAADATLQLHLGLEPWWELADKQWKRTARKVLKRR